MKKSGVLIGMVILVVVAGGAFLLMNKKPGTNPTTSSTANSNAPVAATITYSGNSFSPTTITVKSGDTVAIKNTANEELQLDSNPHPVHTDDTDLNVGSVATGQTKTFVVTKKGSFGYHNHLNTGATGKIIVE